MSTIDLVSIADNDNDTNTLLFGDSGNPLNGRHSVASAVRDIVLNSDKIGSWLLRSADGWYDVRDKCRIDADPALNGRFSTVLFDPLRHYRDRLALYRAEHGLSWPIVTMAHSIGYGPWNARGQADLLWNAQPQDLVIFPSAASQEAWTHLADHILELVQRASTRPREYILPYWLKKEVGQDASSAPQTLAPVKDRSEPATLLTIGRLDPIEKFDFVAYATACQKVVSGAKHPNLRVIIAGRERSPDNTAWITAIFRELAPSVEVDIRPDVAEEDKWSLYRRASALIQPTNSHAESFGLVLDEAASKGLPIVCTDFSGQREAIGSYTDVYYVSGRWVEPSAGTVDGLLQYGRLPGGVVNSNSLSEGIEWALSTKRCVTSTHRPSISQFETALLERLLGSVQLVEAGTLVAGTNKESLILKAFSHYWHDAPER